MGKINKTFLVSFCLSALVVTSSILGFSGALSQGNQKATYSNWMSFVDDDTSLRNVSMPGSHDTMALYSIGNLAGQCQSLSLEDQLELGIRFLDIRLQEVNNKLKSVHGFIDQRATMDDINKTVEKFLKNNPSETIIMSVKEESDSKNSNISFEDSLKTYLGSNIYCLDTSLPDSLGDVRGKVVLLSRYPNSTIGIPAYEGWKDSTTFTMPSTDIHVQDTYKITNDEQKKQEIISCFNETGHNLKINFLSAYNTKAFPPSYAPSAAHGINSWIDKEISKYSDRNIVVYDFVSKSNMDSFFKGIL